MNTFGPDLSAIRPDVVWAMWQGLPLVANGRAYNSASAPMICMSMAFFKTKSWAV